MLTHARDLLVLFRAGFFPNFAFYSMSKASGVGSGGAGDASAPPKF